jgi:hypothetical protein
LSNDESAVQFASPRFWFGQSVSVPYAFSPAQ